MAEQQNLKSSVKETILYYPTISIPTTKWLRQAILYWDEIGSIVPERYGTAEADLYTEDINYLIDEGQFKPFSPDLIFQADGHVVENFQNELVDTVLSDEFQNKLAPIENRNFSARIHRGKITEMMFGFFVEAGLAIDHRNLGDWYGFENKTALLYMSVLAKYLADVNKHTVSGTDFRQYNDLNFHSKTRSESFQALNVKFFNILPVPREENSLQDILMFKRRRRDELIGFRQLIKEFQRKIKGCQSSFELNDTLSDFSLKLEKGVKDLEETMQDAKLARIAGSLETLIKPTSPAWLPVAAAGLGLATMPIGLTIAGTLVAGAVGVGKYLVDKRNEGRATRRNSPFTYLYSAKKLSINN